MFGFFRQKRNKKFNRRLTDRKVIEPASSTTPFDGGTSLVTMVLNYVLRQYGIPSKWIVCTDVTKMKKGDHDSLCIQLTIKHWDPRLMMYALVLQSSVLQAMDMFEQSIDHSHYTIAWGLDKRVSHEVLEMPKPETWTTNPSTLLITDAGSRLITLRQQVSAQPAAPIVSESPKRPVLSEWDHRNQAFADTDIGVF